MKNIRDKFLKTLFVINTIIFLISFPIAVLLLFRPFYYVQIGLLHIEEESGYSYQEIKDGYDAILDYSVFYRPFSLGKFIYSEEGKRHFEDCRILFSLDFIFVIISLILMILQKKYCSQWRIKNHTIGFWSGSFLLGLILLLLLSSIIFGFDNLFTLFHSIFFFGKDNWLLDPELDPIILILPEQFFMNCAIFVLIMICSGSIFLIIRDKLSLHTS